MSAIELNQLETELLVRILKKQIEEIRMEIADTDSKSFRDGLKEDENMMKMVLEKLSSD